MRRRRQSQYRSRVAPANTKKKSSKPSSAKSKPAKPQRKTNLNGQRPLLLRLLGKLLRPKSAKPQASEKGRHKPARQVESPEKGRFAKDVLQKSSRVSPNPRLKPSLSENKRAIHRVTHHRMLGVVVGCLAVFVLIAGRLAYLQVITSGDLKAKAAQARSHSTTLYHRGDILDRHGNILAQDQVVYDAFAHPQYFHDLTPSQIASAIAPMLKLPVKRLTEQLSRPYSTIRLASNLPYDTVQTLKRLHVKTDTGKTVSVTGLDFPKKTVRRYPQGALAAHVIGYANDDNSTSSGIEATQRDTLKHLVPLLNDAPVLDGRGQLMAVEELKSTEMVANPKSDDVPLTIDTRLQFLAEKALKTGLERAKATRGTVIMLRPQTGEVLAFAVAPTYEPEYYYRAPYTTLKNWALSDVYPPGSTMKILTVANGIEAGVIKENSRILDTGKMTIGGWRIQNYDYYRHPYPGMISLVDLFEHSSNIASAKIALDTPKPRQYQLLQQLGLGQKTGIQLPGESAGILPDHDDWSESTHASLGYGYGLAATPLQMAAAVATIANDGVWVQPHVVKQPAKAVPRRRVLETETAQAVQRLLEKAINRPKRSTVKIPGLRIAGKTGTSRKPNPNGKGYSTDIFTSFVGFYPAEQPKVLMFVVVDSPKMAQSWGSTVAGPIFKDIAENSLDYLGLKSMVTD